MTAAATQAPSRPRQTGWLANTLRWTTGAVVWLALALVFSVLVEWVCMTWVWPDEGPAHSARMVEQELTYLNADFRRSVVTRAPVEFALDMGERTYHAVFEWTGIATAVHWALRTDGSPSRVRLMMRDIAIALLDYIEAA